VADRENGNGEAFDIYGGRDPREQPAYPLDIAFRLLLLPRSTLKAWVFGARWKQKENGHFRWRTFEPLITPPDRSDPHRMLSFVNLVEAHVLKAVRRKHYVQMDKVRDAIERLKQRYETEHPLADVDLLAGGGDLFLSEYGGLLNLTMSEQVAMDFLRIYLERIDRQVQKAIRLFPFVRAPIVIGKKVFDPSPNRTIVIDPYTSFGRPVIVGTGIPTEAIAQRFWGGDSIEDLIKDFGRTEAEIQFALRYEHAQLAQSTG